MTIVPRTSSCSDQFPLIFLDAWQLSRVGKVIHLVLDPLSYGLLQGHVLGLAEVECFQVGGQIDVCHGPWFVIVFKNGAHALQASIHLVPTNQVVVLLGVVLRFLQCWYIAFGRHN